MPLFQLFELIENLFGFPGNERQSHSKSDHTKRKLSETTDICINCANKTISHSSVQLLDFPSVSLLFGLDFF
jgi:hypothetical protein